METQQANRLAYKSLGITPPDDFNVRPWQEWCSEAAHTAKGRVLHQFILNHARPLQLLNVWDANGRGVILTNASDEAVAAIRVKFPILADARIETKMRTESKSWWLAIQPLAGVYFDDSQKTIDRVREMTEWTAVLVR